MGTPSLAAHATTLAVVDSVNVGMVKAIQWRDRLITTAIWKQPLAGPVEVRGVNLAGDDQADRRVHGGPDKAVYAYAGEDLDWWAAQLGRPLVAGTFGENLTVRGLPVTGAIIGERWRLGSVLLEVAEPRVPCYKLGIRMGDPAFPRRFAAAGRPGAYLRILRPGTVAAGDTIQVVHRPGHEPSVGEVAVIYHADRGHVARLLQAPKLGVGWQHWARSQLAHRQPSGGRRAQAQRR
jgi:MOSC domain-containing protein YiiM